MICRRVSNEIRGSGKLADHSISLAEEDVSTGELCRDAEVLPAPLVVHCYDVKPGVNTTAGHQKQSACFKFCVAVLFLVMDFPASPGFFLFSFFFPVFSPRTEKPSRPPSPVEIFVCNCSPDILLCLPFFVARSVSDYAHLQATGWLGTTCGEDTTGSFSCCRRPDSNRGMSCQRGPPVSSSFRHRRRLLVAFD